LATGKGGDALETIDNELQSLRRQITSLTDELNELRRRDDLLHFSIRRLDEELKMAARVQQDFLPKTLPAIGRVRFSTLYRPAGFVSGDLYDVMRLDESHVGFYMADAVGHGIPAALLTMFLKNALVTKQILPGGYRLLPPGETLARLNDSLVEQNLSQATFATAVYGIIDVNTLEIRLARGGHPSPLRLKRNGEIASLDAEGSLLGIFPNEHFEETTVQLEAGDRLFLFTDGVEVAFSGDRSMDTQQWCGELRARHLLSTEAIIADFAQMLDRTAATAQLKDDLALIVMDVQ
jgi:serine phosphatase RsbU (regulator of sigma subunit)